MTAFSVTANLGDSHRVDQAAKEPGFWKRLHHAIVQARLRQAEREIAVYLEAHGGRFTDQLERRILDRVSGLDRSGFGV
ncbi:MAG: hypothetical protein ACHQAY_21695 [Hyphomicrobiales bacterium]